MCELRLVLFYWADAIAADIADTLECEQGARSLERWLIVAGAGTMQPTV